MTSPEYPARTFTGTARRAQIIRAAITTVNEIGYHRASLAEIAVRAGVGKSAIVYYFASKESLLLSVVDEVFGRQYEAMLPAVHAEPDPASQLRAYARAYLEFVDSHREEVTAGIEIVVSHRTEDGTPLYLSGTEEDSELLRRVLSDGMDAGVFRRMPLRIAVSLVESLLDVWTTELQHDLNAELGNFGEETIDFLLQGLAVTRPKDADTAKTP
ncbi:TetR/AcrR family transcriptional regulator [Arthrobacter sp. ATA002]|uniref:TetR/AcrR family transcriptional regulator n=1 Tax=Arthrobacter sp. ATA002 TaxID=2991715 RepID=UPI0022A6B58F|nr:TetR/AcrR family transcriptional regulator [Arthrobacter sp. ATA002]WAP50590.1 TetR/AcrR family transcriptional regulator [Arthrobacter sp. ATA002]